MRKSESEKKGIKLQKKGNILFQFLKNLAKKNIENFFDIYSCPSYSHEGEDMLLRKIFENRQQGTYVDIGGRE